MDATNTLQIFICITVVLLRVTLCFTQHLIAGGGDDCGIEGVQPKIL